MIEHETLARKHLDELSCHWKMLGIDEKVEGQIELFQHRNPTQKVRPQQESIIRFRLNNMADAYELRILREGSKLRAHIWRTEIYPTHHPENSRGALRQFEKPARFF